MDDLPFWSIKLGQLKKKQRNIKLLVTKRKKLERILKKYSKQSPKSPYTSKRDEDRKKKRNQNKKKKMDR